MLLVTILVITRVSYDHTPSAYQSLFIIFSPHYRCCLAAAVPCLSYSHTSITAGNAAGRLQMIFGHEQGGGVEGHCVSKGHAKPLKLQQLDCH